MSMPYGAVPARTPMRRLQSPPVLSHRNAVRS
jgi:hypothetical protein